MKYNRLTRRRFLGAALCGMPVMALADAFWFEPGWLKIRRLHFTKGKAAHRFLHFTDLHHKGDKTYLRAVVSKINSFSPEFVCFTGDIVEEACFLGEALEILSTIKSPIYGIPGNHDYWSGADFGVIAKTFQATGGAWLLDQQAVACGGNVNIIGATCTKPLALTFRADGPNIMLIHYPEWVEKLTPHRFKVILAGHSHGGQVRLPFYGALILPFGVGKYDLGLFHTTSGPLYVNPGIGYFHLDVRFCCRPEITVIEI